MTWLSVRNFETGGGLDLKQRWECFQVIFSGLGGQLDDGEQLLQIARKTIAREALGSASYAYARGLRDFPIDEFVTFASEVCPDAGQMTAGRAFARRQRFGMMPLPLHPFWAVSAITWRLGVLMKRLRSTRFGI